MECKMTFNLDDLKGLIATRYNVPKDNVWIEKVECDKPFMVGEAVPDIITIDEPNNIRNKENVKIHVELKHEPYLVPKGY